MLQAERHQYILEKLYRHKAVEVNELATELGVTPMTIRRDLQALEEGGRVKKSHGGAVLSESIAREATYRNRKLSHVEEKRAIAKEALNLIEPSMSVYLDAGTTNYELAILMQERHWEDVTVVTNDLSIGKLLLPVAGIQVIFIGGMLDAESESTCSFFASQMMSAMHVDLAVLGTQAITDDGRVMSAKAEKVGLKRACLKGADRTVLLADASKFGKNKLYYLFDLTAVDMLITDYEIKGSLATLVDGSGIVYKRGKVGER